MGRPGRAGQRSKAVGWAFIWRCSDSPAAARSLISSPSLLFLAPSAASHPPGASPSCQLSAPPAARAQPGGPSMRMRRSAPRRNTKETAKVRGGLGSQRHPSGLKPALFLRQSPPNRRLRNSLALVPFARAAPLTAPRQPGPRRLRQRPVWDVVFLRSAAGEQTRCGCCLQRCDPGRRRPTFCCTALFSAARNRLAHPLVPGAAALSSGLFLTHF
ncbi:unnamed protein product [Tetraodon nigroviridis]|uniref:(spotted green pufferfish) hypothetical protein n=1 Tax=Tetraodon nigroviridis TaxID=99883 RepID=Q4RGK4_TETNG|nr:unnamed protein product [Tetraodon nigroviridis]